MEPAGFTVGQSVMGEGESGHYLLSTPSSQFARAKGTCLSFKPASL